MNRSPSNGSFFVRKLILDFGLLSYYDSEETYTMEVKQMHLQQDIHKEIERMAAIGVSSETIAELLAAMNRAFLTGMNPGTLIATLNLVSPADNYKEESL